MLVVDSSVWIDFFNDARHPAVRTLGELLDHGEIRLVVPDLVLFEVLRGFRHEAAHRRDRLGPGNGDRVAERVVAHPPQLRIDRSLTKIGMSLGRPLTPALATVIQVGWYR